MRKISRSIGRSGKEKGDENSGIWFGDRGPAPVVGQRDEEHAETHVDDEDVPEGEPGHAAAVSRNLTAREYGVK
jgi:hypothetical protein